MKVAREAGKPVLVDFSGFGCVNCRKMEGAVLDEPNVKAMIEDNFTVIKLMVDEKKNLPEPITVKEYGKDIETVTVKVEILSEQRWNKRAHTLERRTPESGDKIDGE
ncbi:thioredoxin family protein [uncultured Duncaniella sp.]|uniref:thioredoxin family protein n=1 Tax=uncultured Duncaniella sp. TaxID=2768039 RepID=UPI0027120E58|nr:thioredoxin family protein [uncultured Duncaniella sp.]